MKKENTLCLYFFTPPIHFSHSDTHSNSMATNNVCPFSIKIINNKSAVQYKRFLGYGNEGTMVFGQIISYNSGHIEIIGKEKKILLVSKIFGL